MLIAKSRCSVPILLCPRRFALSRAFFMTLRAVIECFAMPIPPENSVDGGIFFYTCKKNVDFRLLTIAFFKNYAII